MNKLNTNQYLCDCNSKDVISFKQERLASIGKFKDIIYHAFTSSGINSIANYIVNKSDFINTNNISSWFTDGEECEILRAGSDGWQKGKIKINVTLEFIPDEHDQDKSPLDDVRQELEQK